MNSTEKIEMSKLSLKWMEQSAKAKDGEAAKAYSDCATELLQFSVNGGIAKEKDDKK